MTKEERKAWAAAFWGGHKGAVTGAFTGLVLAILLLLIGFFRTLLIAALMGIGLYLGRIRDRGEEQEAKDKLFALIERKDKQKP